MYNFQNLTTCDWAKDHGFLDALSANPGIITYPGIKDYS